MRTKKRCIVIIKSVFIVYAYQIYSLRHEGFKMSRGYLSLGHLRHLKLLYCEFQKYKVTRY